MFRLMNSLLATFMLKLLLVGIEGTDFVAQATQPQSTFKLFDQSLQKCS